MAAGKQGCRGNGRGECVRGGGDGGQELAHGTDAPVHQLVEHQTVGQHQHIQHLVRPWVVFVGVDKGQDALHGRRGRVADLYRPFALLVERRAEEAAEEVTPSGEDGSVHGERVPVHFEFHIGQVSVSEEPANAEVVPASPEEALLLWVGARRQRQKPDTPLLGAVGVRVHHPHVAERIYRQRVGSFKCSSGRHAVAALDAPVAGQSPHIAAGRHAPDAGVERVGHVDVPRLVHTQIPGAVELGLDAETIAESLLLPARQCGHLPGERVDPPDGAAAAHVHDVHRPSAHTRPSRVDTDGLRADEGRLGAFAVQPLQPP
mmetsp:Transcript_18627/g.44850  ORF Transcript_18627/g.44850 Transcript_18627/m.44850 type:complete len:318 (-) Transcript_18627:684-1637(-)